MANSLYIASLEKDSGKRIMSIGILDLLSRHIDNLGFFRPITSKPPSSDNEILLAKQHYCPRLEVEQMAGISYSEATHMVAKGEERKLFRHIVSKFNEIQQVCDFILCDGPAISSISSAFDYDINLRLARELGTTLICITNGKDASYDELVEKVEIVKNTTRYNDCSLLAILINRVRPEILREMEKKLQAHVGDAFTIDLFPETPALSQPTLREIVTALDAKPLIGASSLMHRNVADIKVAAMSISNYLTHVAQDHLIITPGDRPDIILATLGAISSRNFPSPVGIILSGDLLPSPPMRTLLEGLQEVPLPIFHVPYDTLQTARLAEAVIAQVEPDNEPKLALALGMFEANITTRSIEQMTSTKRPTTVSPLMFEYSLFERARADRKHIVLPEGEDERILQATEILRLRDVVDITLLGNEESIKQKGSDLGLTLKGISIIDPKRSPQREIFADLLFAMRQKKGMTRSIATDLMGDVSYFGTMMVHTGMADGMVSGAVHTTQHTLRPAFQFIKTAPEVLVVSSVFFMCFETRVLVYGDCAVNPNPSSEELAEIAISSAETAAMFKIDPIVAMLSYSSGDSGKGTDVERVRKAVELARARRPDLKIDGPIQYDAAVDAAVAKTKMPESEVAGKANIFIFPDLNTGNNTYKAVQRSAGAIAIGPILQGLNKPVNDLSRGCLVPDIVNTVAITAIQAQAMNIQSMTSARE